MAIKMARVSIPAETPCTKLEGYPSHQCKLQCRKKCNKYSKSRQYDSSKSQNSSLTQLKDIKTVYMLDKEFGSIVSFKWPVTPKGRLMKEIKFKTWKKSKDILHSVEATLKSIWKHKRCQGNPKWNEHS